MCRRGGRERREESDGAGGSVQVDEGRVRASPAGFHISKQHLISPGDHGSCVSSVVADRVARNNVDVALEEGFFDAAVGKEDADGSIEYLFAGEQFSTDNASSSHEHRHVVCLIWHPAHKHNAAEGFGEAIRKTLVQDGAGAAVVGLEDLHLLSQGHSFFCEFLAEEVEATSHMRGSLDVARCVELDSDE
ncbi:uncharacterized protein MYCGRDRAFT_94701 [Zymoseptoria tritici IPO323]|uniref:Uncharacterized protein n=1 Tax=Zymoseptoria tritici (strain CBS 115943 / IPO323) TaxID=336722 RepID=F9XGS8_ZYMTI|nr:uncharacterized protein MYCGRDRAFT_94701 [Zymoseptoria tritici IPO323]EGP85814.1 hypothetical protein MYCGRDRAFT_94701 [Zymoseptoria tritici IPO323]